MTKDRLIGACRSVFGDDAKFDALLKSSTALSQVVEQAAVEAFIFEVDSPDDLAIVRDALKLHRSYGWVVEEDEGTSLYNQPGCATAQTRSPQ